jgi:hypothetical protein
LSHFIKNLPLPPIIKLWIFPIAIFSLIGVIVLFIGNNYHKIKDWNDERSLKNKINKLPKEENKLLTGAVYYTSEFIYPKMLRF